VDVESDVEVEAGEVEMEVGEVTHCGKHDAT
jgi:hypothetical protein